MYHNLHGADFHALAALDAQLLVDHVNAGLGVLGDGTMLAGLHALAALNADHGLCVAILTGNDLDAGVHGIVLLVKGRRAGLSTLQTCHALGIFLNGELLHTESLL